MAEVGRDALPAEVRAAYPEALGGLEVERRYLETERAEEVFRGITNGVAYEMSYAYDAVSFEQIEQDGQYIRLLHEQRLFEISDVLWGANSATVASKGVATLADLHAQLHAHLKAGARHTREEIKQINELHRLIVELGCTTCKGILSDEMEEAAKAEASRAERTPSAAPLDLSLLKYQLFTTFEEIHR
jgi:hypothetical protein